MICTLYIIHGISDRDSAIRSVYTAPNGTVITCEGVVDQIGFGRLLYDSLGEGMGLTDHASYVVEVLEHAKPPVGAKVQSQGRMTSMDGTITEYTYKGYGVTSQGVVLYDPEHPERTKIIEK